MLFQKNQNDKIAEQKIASNLVHPMFKDSYDDVEMQRSKSGKFAKSIDKMVADIIELCLEAKISHKRYKVQANLKPNEIVPAKREKKICYMEWNPFLKNFYGYLLDQLEAHLSR